MEILWDTQQKQMLIKIELNDSIVTYTKKEFELYLTGYEQAIKAFKNKEKCQVITSRKV